jgi:glutaminyl-peptide cyclotransferase
MTRLLRFHGALLALASVLSCVIVAAAGRAPAQAQATTPIESYRVVKVYPHDPAAFTQGLIYRDGFLYESTGVVGRSSLRKVKLETGEVIQQRRAGLETHFAEGLAEWKGQLFQLTWQSKVAFVYDLASFAPRGTFTFSGEGWGLTHDERRFILSDGSNRLRFFDPMTFREIGHVEVTDQGRSVVDLNELEYVNGQVWANVWHTDRIARISPETGRVVGWIDLRGLMAGGFKLDSEAVLNGIAYDAPGKRVFVTGKLWPRLFEIEVIRRARE